MKWLMFGRPHIVRDEAGGGEGGNGGAGGAGGGQGGNGAGGGSGGGEGGSGGSGGTGDGSGGSGGAGGTGGNGSGEKPFLGGKEGQQGGGKEPPKTYEEKDYLAGIVKDEKLLGTDKNVTFDDGLIKAIAPTFKDLGITPEQASKLANAFAKAQLDQAQELSKSRVEYFAKMKDEAMRTYRENDWAQINAGIDSVFKPGGVMNYLIRNSELGADPEVLALMHKLGAAHATDKGVGAGAGGGSGSQGDGNPAHGISAAW